MVFSEYGLACKYGTIFPNINTLLDAELHFLILGVTIANQAKLKQKLD